MFTNEDLERAIDKDIFTRDNVSQFRSMLEQERQNTSVDDENFRLVSGFNDIFVVIACCLFLLSTDWIFSTINSSVANIVVCALTWGLTEYFVRKRKMSLPAIALLIFFIGYIFAFGKSLFPSGSELATPVAGVITLFAAVLHWFRFRVPITIAAATGALVVVVVGTLAYFYPHKLTLFAYFGFICGLLVFSLAMYWDRKDLERIRYHADVAFWLHLLAAPLMVHSVFYILGIFDGNMPLINLLSVVVLYMALTFVSIMIDRRAFMVSALAYVIYALSQLFQSIGQDVFSLAITGAFIGLALLLLSAFWRSVRKASLSVLPNSIRMHLPPAH